MSRKGSMTTASRRAGSARRKLALPSSGARIASTVNTRRSPQGDRGGRQKHPHGNQRHRHRAPVEDDLRRRAFGSRHAEIDQQVAQTVREMKERQGDQHEQVQLHDRVAQDADPGVIVSIHHGDNVQGSEDPLDQDVHRQHKGGKPAALREHKPPEQVAQRHLRRPFRFLDHRPNPIRTAPMTIDATSQRKNIVATIALGGTGRSSTLRWMITPARLRNVTLWYSANKRQMTLKTTKAGELWGAYPLAPALARWISTRNHRSHNASGSAVNSRTMYKK